MGMPPMWSTHVVNSRLRCNAGFDACGHMSEETRNADVSAPWGIVVALGTSAVVGWGYLMALLYSIQVGRRCESGRSLRGQLLCCSARLSSRDKQYISDALIEYYEGTGGVIYPQRAARRCETPFYLSCRTPPT